MEAWTSQIGNGETTQRFAKIRRCSLRCMGDAGRTQCYRGPKTWAVRQRKLEALRELSEGELGPGRERLSSGTLPDSTESRERVRNTLASSFPCFRALMVCPMALTIKSQHAREPMRGNKRAEHKRVRFELRPEQGCYLFTWDERTRKWHSTPIRARKNREDIKQIQKKGRFAWLQ